MKIYYFPKFHCHMGPFKSERLLNFSLFLTNCYCNIFRTTNTMEFVRLISQSFFEGSTITSNFLKSQICNTSYIEINTLFATISNKKLGNFKVRPAHKAGRKPSNIFIQRFSFICCTVCEDLQTIWTFLYRIEFSTHLIWL